MKQLLFQYLQNHFPKSDLSATLCEVNNNIEFGIWTGLKVGDKSSNELGFANELAIEIFESLFLQRKEPIWVLINEWDLNGEDYVIDQLNYLDSENCISWIFFDTTHEVDREQVFIIKQVDDINYKNILMAITNYEVDIFPSIDSRIFFIDPVQHIYYLYWDSHITIGAADASKIESYYTKYYEFINEGNRERFIKSKTSTF